MTLAVSPWILERMSPSSAFASITRGCLSPYSEVRSAKRRDASASCWRSCWMSGDCSTSAMLSSGLPLRAPPDSWMRASRACASMRLVRAVMASADTCEISCVWSVESVERSRPFSARNFSTASSETSTSWRRLLSRSASQTLARLAEFELLVEPRDDVGVGERVHDLRRSAGIARFEGDIDDTRLAVVRDLEIVEEIIDRLRHRGRVRAVGGLGQRPDPDQPGMRDDRLPRRAMPGPRWARAAPG